MKKRRMNPAVDITYSKSAPIDNALDFLGVARDLLDVDIFQQISHAARSFQKTDLHYCQVFVGAASAMLPPKDFQKIITKLFLEKNKDSKTFGGPNERNNA